MFLLKKALAYGIIGFLLSLDGIVYTLVGNIFKLFWQLAEVQLLDNSIYRAITDRIYLFIGIVALFILSFSLLKALVDPDQLSKGVIKSFKALVTSVTLLVLLPSIFSYAFSFQAAIIQDNIIGKFFQIDLNDYKEKGETKFKAQNDSMNKLCDLDGEVTVAPLGYDIKTNKKKCQGNYMAMTALEAFFTPVSNDVESSLNEKWGDVRKYIIYSGDFTYINTFAKQAYDDDENNRVNYTFIISTAVGIFMIYILLSFCIDLGVRAAKIAFYQIIAPIPVLFKIIPGKEESFNKWIKSTISTFLELFVRVILINFVIFIASNLFTIIDSIQGFEEVGFIGKAILLLGLLTFAKQAPKLFSEALALQSGNLKLGIKDKLNGNFVGKAINKGASTVEGATTGALGGGWSGMVNGVGFKSGAMVGAAKGYKAGGNQLNRQRQGVYESFGGRGKAGLFGGRAFIDQKVADTERAGRNNFTERFTNSEEYQNQYNRQLSQQESNRQRNIEAASNNFNNAVNAKEFSENLIKTFRNTPMFRSWSDNLKAQQIVNKKIANGELNGNDPRAVSEAIRKIEIENADRMARTFVASGQDKDGKVQQYLQNVDNQARLANNVIEAKNDLDKAQSLNIEEMAKKSTNEYFRTAKDKDLSFAGKAYKKEMEDKAFKEWKSGSEYAQQTAIMEEALKKLQKDGKGSFTGGAPQGNDKK